MRIEDFSDFSPGHKKSKYGNKKTLYNGVWYDSKLEADFSQQLDLLKCAKDHRIRPIKVDRQVTYSLDVNGIHICKYIADFKITYEDKAVVVDAKGIKTDVYKLKKKLMKAIHNIDIQEHISTKF